MRDVLIDVIKQTSGLVEVIKVTGSATETKLQAVNDTMSLFIEATLTSPVPEFVGEFGLTNLSLLRKLLDFSSYRTEEASFSVKRFTTPDGAEAPELFEFKDSSGVGGSVFRLMNAKRVPEQAEIRNIPWDVSFAPNKAKIAEFQELAGFYTEVDKFFSAKIDKGNLIFCVGDDSSSTHYANLPIESGVRGTLKGEAVYSIAQFLQVLKIAGSNDTEIKITGRGVIGVEVSTALGVYKYYLRAATR